LRRPFIDAVLEGHGELRLHRGVAGITKFRLLLLSKQKFRGLRTVDGVAVGAHNIRLGVSATADIGARKSLGVAPQTGIERFCGSNFGERDNGRFSSASLDVGLAGSMTAFAAGILGRFRTAGNAFVMRIPEKLIKHRRVAALAGLTANIVGASGKGSTQQGGLNHPIELHYFI
jgi:hypothetical protein